MIDLRLWKAGELVKELGEPQYLVDGILLEGAQTLLYAPTSHGKSFVSVDLACHIATGTPFHGLNVIQGPVIYVAAEAPLEIERRVQAWERYHDKKTNNLRIINVPIQLGDSDHMEALIHQAINSLDASLVIFDTAERCTIGTDENLPTEVNQKVNAPIQDMIARTGVTSMLVHHAGVDGRRPRGCTAWETPNDTILRIDTQFMQRKNREQPETITIRVEKQRGAEPVAVKLRTQRIPFRNGRSTLVLTDCDDRGAVVTSESGEPVVKPATKREQVLGLLSEKSYQAQDIANMIYEGNLNSTKAQLSKLKAEGVVESDGAGLWSLA